MPATWFDLGLRDSSESWRAIRRHRASPPGLAQKGARAETFRSALEQAEQQFRAAANVSYESRALNLYYGISQAGRALAAESPALLNNDWRLRGHGLSGVEFVGQSPALDQLSARPEGRAGTTFAGVSSAIGSPPLNGAVRLYEVWPLLVEATLHAPWGDPIFRPLFIHLDQHREALTPHDSAQLSVSSGIDPNDESSVHGLLARYPQLAGYEVAEGTPGVQNQETGNLIHLRWLVDAKAPGTHVLAHRLSRYRGTDLAMPTIAAMGAPLHPLAAWWIVLYTLSMVTRYEPAGWTTLIDVNKSADATVLEYILDMALAAVPDLIDETMTRSQTRDASSP